MPTIINKNGFRVMIYLGDHEPPHVHIFKTGDEVKIDIKTLFVIEDYEMSDKDIGKAVKMVHENQGLLIEEWRRINGNF